MDERARHVAALVREADRDRYLSALYAPEDKRPHLMALYAFNAEIAAIRDRVSEALPGEIRIQWWRDAIAGGSASGNPVAEALLEAIETFSLPRATFDHYLEARIFDLYDDPMPSRTDLEGYCGETASALIQLASLVLDANAAGQHGSLAGHAGCAQAITGIVRLTPIHRVRGQCFVPRDLLSAAGTSPEEFVSSEAGEGAARAMSAMIALAREHLNAFRAGAGALPESLRPAFLPLAVVARYLDLLEGKGGEALKTIAEMSALRRHAAMLRRAWRGWP